MVATATASPIENPRTGFLGATWGPGISEHVERAEKANAEKRVVHDGAQRDFFMQYGIPPEAAHQAANDTRKIVTEKLPGESPTSQYAIENSINRISAMAGEAALKRFDANTQPNDAQINALATEMMNSAVGASLLRGVQSRTPSSVGGGLKTAAGIGLSTTLGTAGGVAKGVGYGLLAGVIAKLWLVPAKAADKIFGTKMSSMLTFKNTLGFGMAVGGLWGGLSGLANKTNNSIISPMARNNMLEQTARQAVIANINTALQKRNATLAKEHTKEEQRDAEQNKEANARDAKQSGKTIIPEVSRQTQTANENEVKKPDLTVAASRMSHDQFIKTHLAGRGADLLSHTTPKGYANWQDMYKALVGKDMPADALAMVSKGPDASAQTVANVAESFRNSFGQMGKVAAAVTGGVEGAPERSGRAAVVNLDGTAFKQAEQGTATTRS